MFSCPWTAQLDGIANDATRCGKSLLPPKRVWTFRRENGNWKKSAVPYKDEKIDRFKKMQYICNNFITIVKSTIFKIQRN